MTIFARLLNFVLCFSLILISGCANTSTIKADAVRIKDKPLLIVPTGATKITGLSSSGGGAFGLLGVLIEHAATSDSRAKAESVVHCSNLLLAESLEKVGRVPDLLGTGAVCAS